MENKKQSTIVQDVINFQASGSWNDAEFSNWLGIDGGTWSKIKRGKWKPTPKFLMAVAIKIPHLHDKALNIGINGNSISKE